MHCFQLFIDLRAFSGVKYGLKDLICVKKILFATLNDDEDDDDDGNVIGEVLSE